MSRGERKEGEERQEMDVRKEGGKYDGGEDDGWMDGMDDDEAVVKGAWESDVVECSALKKWVSKGVLPFLCTIIAPF